jgi:hypothetical protein
MEKQINAALDQRWSQVSAQAEHIESRILGALTDQQPTASRETRELDGVRQTMRSLRDEILQRLSPARANPARLPATVDPSTYPACSVARLSGLPRVA